MSKIKCLLHDCDVAGCVFDEHGQTDNYKHAEYMRDTRLMMDDLQMTIFPPMFATHFNKWKELTDKHQ